ncbi:MAG: NAD-dependent epimerase/dehydratase family protein [Deltaproteobacteria bacterium]|nr:MAG: NAD-dependent epimerase/dehydratase family protein [Deltaproteobacteria bacterium]
MSVAVVTGSAGLVGAAATRLFAERGLEVHGIDNDMRRAFFGDAASTLRTRMELEREVDGYTHCDADVRDREALEKIFRKLGARIRVVIHAAAQPSHDWAALNPQVDFAINANGTLNLLELTRAHCPEAVFIFTSTNKVYGDTPNRLPFVERETRWELPDDHPYGRHGIDESMSLDQSLHSLFGVSKTAADLLVQEYGRNFGLQTVAFRAGCITGPKHAGAPLHGFLAYLVRCAVTGEPYEIFGYRGKQVRDNIHAHDLATAFWEFFQKPRRGEVYNIGGSRHSNCSMLEAIEIAERLVGRPVDRSYSDTHRTGDHIWWISDVRRFQSHYPDWRFRYDLLSIMEEIHEEARARFASR